MYFYTGLTFSGPKSYSGSLDIDKYPALDLVKDNWDDFGTKSQFCLRYHETSNNPKRIGYLKILQKDTDENKTNPSTVLPTQFTSLDAKYISLGQDIDFYRELINTVGEKAAVKVLEALNDISWRSVLAEDFESFTAYRNSLLRENQAQRALKHGKTAISGEEIIDNFNFTYEFKLESASAPLNVCINFDKNDFIPGRMVSIIGRNATGKTQFLSRLAKDLVQVWQTSSEKHNDVSKLFNRQKPLFSRVITISYSAFDKFTIPKSEHISYVYCGIRNKDGKLSGKSLKETYLNNLMRIKEHDRTDIWLKCMQDILDNHSKEYSNSLLKEINSDFNNNEDSLSLLSSGQAILANFITSLVAWLKEDSIVLFDEPETHLHPNAVANLFNVFHSLLEHFDSYAIVATHSPIVIQEIPSKRVIVFNREENLTTASNLSIESFGENISELTRHVFETVTIPNYYKDFFDEKSRKLPFEEIMKLFNNALSINAQSYLLSRYFDETAD